MKNLYNILGAMLLGGTLLSAVSCEEPEVKGPLYGEITTAEYVNPVYAQDTPDPTVVRARNGKFYLYDTPYCHILESEDLVNWQEAGEAFPANLGGFPNWMEGKKGYTWAPDINIIDGKYVLYYALSDLGVGWENGIGVATALKPTGPFTDTGAMFTSEEIGVENSIDPCYFGENDKHYLAWGSYHKIWLVELTPNALRVNSEVEKIELAGTDFEAPMIFKKGNYYYLLCSRGFFGVGINDSTYETVVGRSESLFGPYVNKEGKDMKTNACEVVLTANDSFTGPGHNAEIITDDEGKTWFLYHAYDNSNPDAGRCLMLDELKWDSEGWPYVEGNGPSSSVQNGPVFKN